MRLIHNHPVYVQPDSKSWQRYFQSGGGGPYFKGMLYQTGKGGGALGNIFRSIMSFAKPAAAKLIRTAGPTAAKTLLNVGQDLLEGDNIGESFARRGREAGIETIERARANLAARKQKKPLPGRRRRKGRQIGKGLASRIAFRKKKV